MDRKQFFRAAPEAPTSRAGGDSALGRPPFEVTDLAQIVGIEHLYAGAAQVAM
jgi:hypothetical protein